MASLLRLVLSALILFSLCSLLAEPVHGKLRKPKRVKVQTPFPQDQLGYAGWKLSPKRARASSVTFFVELRYVAGISPFLCAGRTSPTCFRVRGGTITAVFIQDGQGGPR